MLFIWARVIILGYMAVNESNHWHKACRTTSTIGGAVPISAIANTATSCWRLHHHQQQTQVLEKDGERRARWSYVPLHFICDELVIAPTRCTVAHSPSCCLFLSDGSDNNSNIVSFDFRVITPGKKSRACAEHKVQFTTCFTVYKHV